MTTITTQRSTFVNVLAWIFIILGGFATFISLLQNIMFHFLFPEEVMNQTIQNSDSANEIPAAVSFMFNHFDLFFLSFFIISAVSFVSAIGLLKRKNWARLMFIVLMALAILWNLFGLGMQFSIFQSIPHQAQQPAELGNIMHVMQIFSVIMVLAFCFLFGFIIKKLASMKIRQEFV